MKNLFKVFVLIFICFIINTNSSYLSKKWVAKEMTCFKECIITRKYDSFTYKMDEFSKPVCLCNNINLKRVKCTKLTNAQYNKKFAAFKKYFIENKIKPLYKRYNKHFPEIPETFVKSNVGYLPSKNNKPNIKLIID